MNKSRKQQSTPVKQHATTKTTKRKVATVSKKAKSASTKALAADVALKSVQTATRALNTIAPPTYSSSPTLDQHFKCSIVSKLRQSSKTNCTQPPHTFKQATNSHLSSSDPPIHQVSFAFVHSRPLHAPTSSVQFRPNSQTVPETLLGPNLNKVKPSSIISPDFSVPGALKYSLTTLKRTISTSTHHSQFKRYISKQKRLFSTATTTTTVPPPSPGEDATHGANLIQIQQAVNQWAHLNHRGMEFLRAGTVADLDNAEVCFNECATAMEQYPLLPYRSLSLANLGSCLMRKGNYKEAIKLFQPLTQQIQLFKQVGPEVAANLHIELASAYEMAGHHDSAVKELYVASSKYTHAAAHFLAKVQASDQSHFFHALPPHFESLTAAEKEHHLLRLKERADPQSQGSAQHDAMREDERAVAYTQALQCWRTALGCRYSAIVLQHRMANLDFASAELRKLSSVYKYVLDSIESIQKVRWEAGEGEHGDVSAITNEKGEPVDIDRTLTPHPQGRKIIEALPICPPEAKVVTSELVKLLPDVSLHHLQDIYGRVTVEYVSVLHSLANVHIDQGDFDKVCTALEASVDCMNPMDEEAFLKVASESSKTLRLLYEKLLLEQQNYSTATGKQDSEPTVLQISETAKIKLENKGAIEAAIFKLNTSRANILALFSTYISSRVLQTTAPLGLQKKQQDLDSMEHNKSSSYQSSSSSSTINLDDLPQDAKQFFNFAHDKRKGMLESGEYYEKFRAQLQRDLGPQFVEDLPQLLQVKPPGYKALHEREHLADDPTKF